jgi:hypothetical protein
MTISIIAAQAEWQTYETSFTVQRATFLEIRAPLAAQVETFHAEEPSGILRKLSRAFAKATKIAPMERKIGKLDGFIQDEEQSLRNRARNIYKNLGEAALAANGSTTDKDRYAALTDIDKLVHDARGKVAVAIREAEEASTLEMVDMMGNNKGLSLWSYIETDEAKNAIRAAGDSISALNTKLRDTQKQDTALVKDLGFTNTLDLFLDMAGGFAGAFTSYLNMQKLDEAVDKMKGIQKTLGQMTGETGAGLRTLQTAAIKAEAAQNAALGKLVGDMTPYLPEDTAAVLRGQRPALRLSDLGA